jgi:hypothetical protein
VPTVLVSPIVDIKIWLALTDDDLVRKMMDCIEQTTPFYFDSNQLQFAAPPATDSVFWRANGAPKQAPARAQSTGLSPSRRKVDIRACGRICE